MEKLGLIVMENCRDLGEKVNTHLKELLGTTSDFIIPIEEVRFNNGEGKVVLKESVRKRCLYFNGYFKSFNYI